VAAAAGSEPLVLLAWFIGGVATLCLALCLAELGAMYPRAGGLYVFLGEAFGPRAAFLYGWTFLIINPANWAAVALIFSAYGRQALGVTADERTIATAAIGAVTLVNVLSVPLAARLGNLLSVAKLLFLAVLAVGLLRAPVSTLEATTGAVSAGGFIIALVAVLWPYDGITAVASMAGEVKDPSRSLPIGLGGGVVLITAIYLLVNAGFLATLGLSGVATSPFVALDAARRLVGPQAGLFVAAGAALVAFGGLLAAATCDPRILFAMARSGALFPAVGRVSARRGTPQLAVLFSAALSLIYVWSRTFEALAAQYILGMWIFYGATVVGLLHLRRQAPDLARPFKVPGYPFVPILVVVATLLLILSGFFESFWISILNLGIVALGWPAYELRRRMSGGGVREVGATS
jgi:basic amino acid/polyamine antiporter, APA family